MFNIEYCFVAKSFRRDFAVKSPVISARENPPLKRTQRAGNYKLFLFALHTLPF